MLNGNCLECQAHTFTQLLLIVWDYFTDALSLKLTESENRLSSQNLMRDSGIFYLPVCGSRQSGYFHRELDFTIDEEHNMDRRLAEI